MGHQDVVQRIHAQLSQLNLVCRFGHDTDLTVQADFLDASWSSGTKKIAYEASILVNERDQTVYFWEKTTETGSGFSFGGESSTSFQSGKTLFRKVKSIQYGPDGKAYEYVLDLGAIPKTVKETAKAMGWNFKTVLKKSKAQYPDGYRPAAVQQAAQPAPAASQPISSGAGFCSNCGASRTEGATFCVQCGSPFTEAVSQTNSQATQQPASQSDFAASPPQANYSNPQGTFYANVPAANNPKSNKKGGVFGLIGFILLGIVLLIVLLAAETAPVGWIVSLALFAIAFFIQRKLKNRGCLTQIILWIITGLLVLFTAVMFTADGEVNFTTANLKNAQMASAIGDDGKPVDKISSYTPEAPEFVAAAELRNAPANTQVKFIWIYETEDMVITEYLMDSGDNESNVYVFSNLTLGRQWPEGEYKVEMYIEDREKPDAVVSFEVK